MKFLIADRYETPNPQNHQKDTEQNIEKLQKTLTKKFVKDAMGIKSDVFWRICNELPSSYLADK